MGQSLREWLERVFLYLATSVRSKDQKTLEVVSAADNDDNTSLDDGGVWEVGVRVERLFSTHIQIYKFAEENEARARNTALEAAQVMNPDSLVEIVWCFPWWQWEFSVDL